MIMAKLLLIQNNPVIQCLSYAKVLRFIFTDICFLTYTMPWFALVQTGCAILLLSLLYVLALCFSRLAALLPLFLNSVYWQAVDNWLFYIWSSIQKNRQLVWVGKFSFNWFSFFITGDWNFNNLIDYFSGNQVVNNLDENLSDENVSLLQNSQELEADLDIDNNQDWEENYNDVEEDLTQGQLNYQARIIHHNNRKALNYEFPAPYKGFSPNPDWQSTTSSIPAANYSFPLDSDALNLRLRDLEEGQGLNVELENTGSKVLKYSLAFGVTIVLFSLMAFILYSGMTDTQALSPVEV